MLSLDHPKITTYIDSVGDGEYAPAWSIRATRWSQDRDWWSGDNGADLEQKLQELLDDGDHEHIRVTICLPG